MKVAVLGGGPAALAAAFELTAPEAQGRFEVTVYQPGWRLGGKCASGRNMERQGRIEEHGLHVWFGFYDNSFRLARAVYEELGRSAQHPMATLEDAFEPCDQLVLSDRHDDRWRAFPITFPRNEFLPGGNERLPDFWGIAARMCDWALERWTLLNPHPHSAARVAKALLGLARSVAHRRVLANERALSLALLRMRRDGRARRGRASERARLLAGLLTLSRDFMWQHGVRERCQADAQLRLFFTTFDTFASAIAGIVRDGVIGRGWQAINDRDLCEWLAAHGAKEVTLGASPARRAPLLRAIYDVAFAYPEGNIDAANAAAGTAISNLLRLLFAYRGSVLYKMRAGMGDAVIAPLYELLCRRGVKFEFFSAVTELRCSRDGSLIDTIDVVPQAELVDGAYSPLVSVAGLDCWPSEPRWGQLRGGAGLKQARVDFERESNPLGRAARTLTRGEDFDALVLGIPVAVLPEICSQVAAHHPRFARMIASAETVATQAFQLWLTKPPSELGWEHGENSVSGTHVDPLNSWSDMSHLLEREARHECERVRGIAYFCGVLEDRVSESHAEADARVKDNARAFVEAQLGHIWPGALRAPGSHAIEWSLLADGSERTGASRLAAQHWSANTTPSERYVLSTTGALADRLAPDQSGVQNMALAGDWTRNGVDGGCVEAAVTSGMQAASALCSYARRRERSGLALTPLNRSAKMNNDKTGGSRSCSTSNTVHV